MKLTHFIIVFLLSCIIFSGCKNDIEINAPWKETAVVYGFLDISQTTQYIRIEKLFQNASNLTPQQAAQISDSLFFDTLQVNLYDLSLPSGSAPIKFYRTNNIPKDPGYFSNKKNYTYQAVYTPIEGHNYKLEIINPKSGNKYYGASSVVGTFTIACNSNSPIKISIDPNLPIFINFKWEKANNALIYDAFLRYTYTEEADTVNQSGVITTQTVDEFIAFNEEKVTSFTVYSKELNSFLASYFKDKYKPYCKRAITHLHYYVLAGSKDLKEAIDMSKASLSLLQIKPDYSNIQGGLGVFSSRSTVSKEIFFMDPSQKLTLTKGVNNFPQ